MALSAATLKMFIWLQRVLDGLEKLFWAAWLSATNARGQARTPPRPSAERDWSARRPPPPPLRGPRGNVRAPPPPPLPPAGKIASFVGVLLPTERKPEGARRTLLHNFILLFAVSLGSCSRNGLGLHRCCPWVAGSEPQQQSTGASEKKNRLNFSRTD